MNVDTLIMGLTERSNTSLTKMRSNATRNLRARPDDAKLLRLINAVDGELLRRLVPPRNGWTSGTQGDPRFLMHDGRPVALVQRMETHRATNGGVYLVEVLGRAFPGRFRHVEDARKAAYDTFTTYLQQESVTD